MVFVPFLGDFFSIFPTPSGNIVKMDGIVFVPFLGDFFSICCETPDGTQIRTVFVPFLGDFFSIGYRKRH